VDESLLKYKAEQTYILLLLSCWGNCRQLTFSSIPFIPFSHFTHRSPSSIFFLLFLTSKKTWTNVGQPPKGGALIFYLRKWNLFFFVLMRRKKKYNEYSVIVRNSCENFAMLVAAVFFSYSIIKRLLFSQSEWTVLFVLTSGALVKMSETFTGINS